tara:strand:- start:713 stop:2539 length:1827 start_codon:yes stop_codon:yes gene_type:complete
MNKYNSYLSSLKRRCGFYNQFNVLVYGSIIFFGAIIIRVYWLQIIQGKYYKKLAEENRIRLVAKEPIRGRLLDRNGNILADNKVKYSLSVQPRLLDNNTWAELRNSLSKDLEIPSQILQQRYEKGLGKDPYRITLISDLKPKQVLRFKEQENNFKGAQVDINLVRFYPFRTLASHVLGYTQQITPDEYRSLSKNGYKISDRIGRTGVEAAYESVLRGEWGGEMLEVNAAGVIQRSLGIREPFAGEDIYLTIDLTLQLAAEEALADKKAGAVVVLEPKTGAILAMASRPTYDPNFFSKSFMSQKEYDGLFLSKKRPLFSRAINAYDPGSTWKPVTAIAGMESGKFPSDIRLETVPCLKYGGHCFPEHNGKGFGWIGYEDALRVSSNTFFYQVGVGSGIEFLYDAAVKMGFNSLTGIEIGYEESKGFVANKEWAEKGRGWGKPGQTPWIPEDIASASIGQAVVQITPLQLARAYAVFANGGFLVTPHLSNRKIDWMSQDYRQKVNIKDSTISTIRRGLRKVIESGTGSSLNYLLPGLPPSAGKSGTAEDSTGGTDHAWFVCFAPYDSSEIVIVAFAQNKPGGGSVHALPMAQKVLAAWHNERTNKNSSSQ